MTITYGPKLGLMVNGDQGEEHYLPLMKLLRAIDALVQCTVIERGRNTPPTSPADGDCYIVGTSPTGAWSSHENAIARWSAVPAEWEFYAPNPGWLAYSNAEEQHFRFTSLEGWILSSSPPQFTRFQGALGSAELLFDNSEGRAFDSAEFNQSGLVYGSARTSGKRYFEFNPVASIDSTGNVFLWIAPVGLVAAYEEFSHNGGDCISVGAYRSDGYVVHDGSTEVAVTPVVDFDTVNFAVDLDAGKFWIGVNAIYFSGDPEAGTGGYDFGSTSPQGYRPAASFFEHSRSAYLATRASDFFNGPPTGFVAWDA